MKTKFLFMTLMFSVFSNLNAQSYNDLWKDVNKNLDNRLPQSAEIKLNEIEQKAVKENNQKELLKTFLYRFKIFSLQDENPIETSINFAEENVSIFQEPEKSILNIAIASLYESYLNNYYHIIKINLPIYYGQQTTDNGQQTLSMKFWDEATFKRVINKYYENSLADIKSLQHNSTQSYKDILAINDETAEFDFNIEPTLYDYVVHKIIRHKVVESQSCDELYQQLIDFDKKNNYSDAAIYNEIQKLKYEYGTSDDYETYLNSLEKIKNENIDNPLVTSVMALQAEAIRSQQTTDNGQQSTAKLALEICNEAIKLFPKSVGAESCEAIRSEILNKELRFYMKKVQLPDKNISVELTYKNLTNPHYRIYKVSPEKLKYINKLYHDKKEFAKEIVKYELVVENYFDIKDNKDYHEHTSSFELQGLPCGTYYMICSKDDNFDMTNNDYPAIHSFQVSNLSYVVTNENDNSIIYVLDRETGKPIKDVNVNVFEQNYDYKLREYVKNNLDNLKTDRNGCAKLPYTHNQYHIELSNGNDILLSDLYISNYCQDEEKLSERTTFFTDRAIYRSGQTVYFKGIILNENSVKKELVVGKETKVLLKDSNWQEVATQTFTTNEYGSFDGSFVIPNNISNGYFSIKNESGNINIKVEEYKRPTFEIIFNNPDKSFKLNEEIDLSGTIKAYAGFGLENVNYNYTIVRRSYFPYRLWWFNNYSNNETQIAFGEGTTDNEGNFNINFKLIPDNDEKDKLPVYEYIVTVNATNAQGETKSKNYTLRASEIDLIIDVESQNEFVFKDSLDLIKFNVKNLKDIPVEAKIIRKIFKVNGQQITDNRLLPQDSILIYEDEINVDGKYGLFQDVNKNLGIGKYVVELISVDNELAKTSVELTIVDYHKNKMPYETMCISYYDKKTAQPEDNVNFYLGSSADDVNVFYMIKHGNEVRHYGRKTISNKILTIPYKVKEEDRDEISFQAFFVKNNTINIVTHEVSIPYENLRLDIRLDVERDDLLPGAEERWNLTIKNFKNEGVVANLLAGMYDASLDVFARNHWYLNVIPETPYAIPPKVDLSFDNFDSEASFKYYINTGVFDYFLLSMVGITPYSGSPRFAGGGKMYSMMVAEKSSREASNEEEMLDVANQKEQSVVNQEMSIRENFNETAFFYPNLMTNEDGSLTFSFTMPDALTRWNLMMLAYTKDLKVGTLNKTFTTSKPLMIMSDMPRFCYENDTLWLVANVIRTTDNGQQTTDYDHASAELEIFDALTMKPLDLILSEKEINIGDISECDSKSVRWKVRVNEDETNLLAVRFSVKTENFSDAEQRLLPILSDEVFMTETYPFTLEPDSEMIICLEDTRPCVSTGDVLNLDLDNENERNQGVTLNYCSTPVWYAIQALPYLAQETGDHADVAFNIFYANSLASYIAHNIPNFLNYIKEWKINSPDALMSQLQKDENLKAIMLQETPWVLEAKTEAEQKSRIANLFDVNALRYKTDEYLNIIKENQSVNGGWSWFKNMPESPFITQYILGGFGRLYKMNVIETFGDEQQSIIRIISDKATDYMRKEIIDDYNYFNDKNLDYNPNSYSINELYSLSFFKSNESEKYKTAKSFFIEKVENNWQDLNFSSQAKAAIILHREGKEKTAQLIMESLKERMPQLKNTTDVATQTLVMEAFKEIAPDKQILNEMMIGLLNNKRTNMWENARSSVDAIYAIITVNSQQSTVNSVDATQIFIQKYWNAEELKDIKNYTIENTNDNIAWGGLFRQYFVSVDEVRKHETQELNIERNLYVERVNEEGKCLVPIEETDIKVGDKIVVNLSFEASQDMEFVFLKDLRAACFEPTEQMSGYKFSDGMFYYQSNSDIFMGFYFDNVTKGKHQVSYSLYVTKEGSFSNGYALIQCMYAPEFSGYSEGMRIKVLRN